MKGIFVAGIVVAAAAWTLSLSFTRRASDGTTIPEKTTQTETESRQTPADSADEVPGTRGVDGLPASPVQPKRGVTLKVRGLPPITLGGLDAAPWEKTIDGITRRDDISNSEKARRLIEMLPGLPREVVIRAAEEATVRLPDGDYRGVLSPTLINPQTDGMTMSVLFSDLMERPSEVSLPILLSIARDPQHSYSPFARENLELVLGRDMGGDWAKWELAIREYLESPKK